LDFAYYSHGMEVLLSTGEVDRMRVPVVFLVLRWFFSLMSGWIKGSIVS